VGTLRMWEGMLFGRFGRFGGGDYPDLNTKSLKSCFELSFAGAGPRSASLLTLFGCWGAGTQLTQVFKFSAFVCTVLE